jgi:stage V sporulation protein AD
LIKISKILTAEVLVVHVFGTVFSGYIYNQLKQKKLKKILLIATGALTNATTTQQGESIPGIAHAISIEI